MNKLTSSKANQGDEVKPTVSRLLIQRYFLQLTEGCGNLQCKNEFCATANILGPVPTNPAAKYAVELYLQNQLLCYVEPSQILNISNMKHVNILIENLYQVQDDIATIATNSNSILIGERLAFKEVKQEKEYTHLDEESVYQLLKLGAEKNCYDELIQLIKKVFNSVDLLSNSFQRKKSSSLSIDKSFKKTPRVLKGAKNKDLRVFREDLDKNKDTNDDLNDNIKPLTYVDICSLRRGMIKIFQSKCNVFEELNFAIKALSAVINKEINRNKSKTFIEKSIDIFFMIFELISLEYSKFLIGVLPNICRAASCLPLWAQAKLAVIWAKYCKENLHIILQSLLQLISTEVYSGNINDYTSIIQYNIVIRNATKVIRIIYCSNILAGQYDTTKNLEKETNLLPYREALYKLQNKLWEDILAKILY